jgi:hypothetical protein
VQQRQCASGHIIARPICNTVFASSVGVFVIERAAARAHGNNFSLPQLLSALPLPKVPAVLSTIVWPASLAHVHAHEVHRHGNKCRAQLLNAKRYQKWHLLWRRCSTNAVFMSTKFEPCVQHAVLMRYFLLQVLRFAGPKWQSVLSDVAGNEPPRQSSS